MAVSFVSRTEAPACVIAASNPRTSGTPSIFNPRTIAEPDPRSQVFHLHHRHREVRPQHHFAAHRIVDTIYASAYQRRRHTGVLVAGGPEGMIYRTDNGGKSWKKLDKGLPTVDKGRIALAVSPGERSTVSEISPSAPWLSTSKSSNANPNSVGVSVWPKDVPVNVPALLA